MKTSIEQGKYSVEAELSLLSNEMMFTIKVEECNLVSNYAL